MQNNMIRLAVVLLFFSAQIAAGPLSDTIKALDFQLLEQTFDDAKVKKILSDSIGLPDPDEAAAAAVLVSIGAISADDLRHPEQLAERLRTFSLTIKSAHPDLMGRIGEPSLFMAMASAWNHTELKQAYELINALGDALQAGVVTGYDLRRKGVYDGFPEGKTLIYSQSSLLHMRQLVALLHSEDIRGWVYVTPKVSAFLYRDDWGPANNTVKTLANGVRVVNGEEIAGLFHFDDETDLQRFHQIVTQYAKKDTADEPGLIENAWWQPFYYSDAPLEGFEAISLIVLSSNNHEATLTVLKEKTAGVLDALRSTSWPIRVETVWVNPPFYRFLQGGYK